jgi:YhcH/YjgK/YiaL family protein
MIYDDLSNLHFYFHGRPNFDKIQDYLSSLSSDSEDGTRDLDYCKVIISSYVTEHSSLCESHEIYDDLHMVLQGQEAVEFYNPKLNKVKFNYDEDKDVTLYYKEAMPTVTLPLFNRKFCYLPAGEVHSPGLPHKVGPSYVKKVVVKIKTND